MCWLRGGGVLNVREEDGSKFLVPGGGPSWNSAKDLV